MVIEGAVNLALNILGTTSFVGGVATYAPEALRLFGPTRPKPPLLNDETREAMKASAEQMNIMGLSSGECAPS